MPKDLTIRELGRPQISKESQIGLQKITRKFVAQGNRVAVAELNQATNPLFLAVGTPDDEYTDHVLVNQQVTSVSGDVDRAYLTSEYVQLRDTFFAESSNQSSDLKRISRKYAVLRSDDATFGYGTTQWAKHPNNPTSGYSSDLTPGDYMPNWISAPSRITYSYAEGNGGFSNSNLKVVTGVDTNGFPIFGNTLSEVQNQVGAGDMGLWLPGRISVNQSMPGIDIWDVEWVTHNTPYWTVGTARGASSKSVPLTVVDFDENGLILDDYGSSGGSSTSLTVARTNVFFYVGKDVPQKFINIGGGTDSSFVPNTVNVDIVISTRDRKTITEKQLIKNAVFRVTGTGSSSGLTFPTVSKNPATGQNVTTVGERNGARRIIFNYQGTGNPFDFVQYKGDFVRRIGGSISWTRSHLVTGSSSSSTPTDLYATNTKITPLFTFGDEKIWKIEVTYIG